ncbi:MAG TPA: type I 3-dehydroquinate dehydratase [Chthoniobacteraceae bacterium]|nr:type I 3-dehydroquinate dehydratase [Chthoniobacteraceae bacterium]
MNPFEIATSLSQPEIVGTVHSTDSLAAARKIKKTQCDWLELRVDSFFPLTDALLRAAPKLPLPCIITVRHPAEGGAAPGITPAERRALYATFLDSATLIDIELRSAAPMRETIRMARERGVGLILSHHDFTRTPSLSKLRTLAHRARAAGADIFKVAAMTHTPRDIAVLLEFLASEKTRLPLAVMGMGAYGKVSRLILSQTGSRLNYGYLGRANASGQWPVAVLKARLGEIMAEE